VTFLWHATSQKTGKLQTFYRSWRSWTLARDTLLSRGSSMPGSSHPQTAIRFGPFEADLQTRELRKNGVRLRLPNQSFQILEMLLERPGQLVGREELHACLWPSDTFVDFEKGINAAVKRLREALGDSPENPKMIETLPKRGYRFIGAIAPALSSTVPSDDQVGGHNYWMIVGICIVAVAALATGTYFYLRRPPALTVKDTIVLADFTNTTGDAVFDGTLRQALEMQLDQSPFLSLISESRIRQTLRQMGQPSDARLTPDIAQGLCQRTNSVAVLEGSIHNLGNQYILGITAVDCRTGDTLGAEQMQAIGKEKVLDALGLATTRLRTKLGESLSTVQKFDTPIEQATTPSLEALQAYSIARKIQRGKNDKAAAVPFFQRAIEIDPNFAMAYASLAVSYQNLGEPSLAAENARKAFELRAQVSEREKFYIESHYYHYVTGDLVKARQVYELWANTYPRDAGPRNNLGNIYLQLGQMDRALEEFRATHSVTPSSMSYSNLINAFLFLNRVQEARSTADEAQAKKIDSDYLRFNLYLLAFLQNDPEGMARQVAGSEGKPGFEEGLLYEVADTSGYFGRLNNAREFSRRAVASAIRAKEKEAPASYEAESALREAVYGNGGRARERAAAALELSTGREVQYGAALALAFTGHAIRAEALASDLDKRFPEDTIVQFNYLPTIRAQLALLGNDSESSFGTNSSKAIEILHRAAPFDLSLPGGGVFTPALYPVYVRGQAYLVAHLGPEAAAEFQRILDWRGVVQTEPIGALAYLGLARAHALQGNNVKARAAYQDFLMLWKDADSDIPILKQAKVESAKLQ
jgi:DNA-binding winged helix-turn-helix (wHTH) protein/tetratricopeptide (TPR) repeat protein